MCALQLNIPIEQCGNALLLTFSRRAHGRGATLNRRKFEKNKKSFEKVRKNS